MEDGTVLICDEISEEKNIGASRTKALVAMVRHIQLHGENGKVILLSASPGDKLVHAAAFTKLLGLVRHPYLFVYNPSARVYAWKDYGLGELLIWCVGQDEVKTRRIVQDWQSNNPRITPNSLYLLNYRLYMDIARPRLSGAGPAPPVKANVCNGFFSLEECYMPLLKQGIDDLANAVRQIDEAKMVQGAYAATFGRITEALMCISHAKIPLYLRLIGQSLISDLQLKIVFCFNYKAPLHHAAHVFNHYKPLIFTGDQTLSERDEAIELFNKPTTEHRLFLCTLASGNMGINLHDTHGSYKRIMFIEPTFHFLQLFQAAGRVARIGGVSKPNIYVVYVQNKTAVMELSLLDNMAHKSVVARSYVPHTKSVPFPAEYRSYQEEKRNYYPIPAEWTQ